MDETIKKIADQLAAEKTVSRMERAFDEKKWDVLRSLLTDSVEVDIGIFSGKEIIVLDGDVFCAGMEERNGPDKTVFHSRSNVITDVDGDRATVSATNYAQIYCAKVEPSLYEVWGVMTYKLSHTEKGWLVSGVRQEKWREAGNLSLPDYRAEQ
ncbi:MAG: nuclear transport factor 2 family protein [Caulobacterales bacterium]